MKMPECFEAHTGVPRHKDRSEFEAAAELARTLGASGNWRSRRALRQALYEEAVYTGAARATRRTLPGGLLPYSARPEWLAARVSSPLPLVREALWFLPLLPSRFLRWAASSSDVFLRRSAAGHDMCPPDVLVQLSLDPVPSVAERANEVIRLDAHLDPRYFDDLYDQDS